MSSRLVSRMSSASRVVNERWWRKWRQSGLQHLPADEKLAQLLKEDGTETESDGDESDCEVYGDEKSGGLRRKANVLQVVNTSNIQQAPLVKTKELETEKQEELGTTKEEKTKSSTPLSTTTPHPWVPNGSDLITWVGVVVLVFMIFIWAATSETQRLKHEDLKIQLGRIREQNFKCVDEAHELRAFTNNIPKLSRRLTELIEAEAVSRRK